MGVTGGPLLAEKVVPSEAVADTVVSKLPKTSAVLGFGNAVSLGLAEFLATSRRVNMEIECYVHLDGNVKIHVASILYDLWDDYLHFRKEAENIDRNLEGLRYKRLVRASINAFYNYFDGVLNQWIANLDPLFDFDHASIGKKIGFVRNRIRSGRKLPRLDQETSRLLRNKICHLKLGDSDLEIVEKLLDGKFFSDADQIVNWMRIASTRLEMECHPNVPQVMREFTDAVREAISKPMG
jgi:hypothetical protein